MKLPKELDTTEWALAQERVFMGEAEPGTARKFNELMYLQESICPTNLTIRQRLIMSDIVGAQLPPFTAISQFNTLRKNDYWAEGLSYWNYTRAGLDWYHKRHGLPSVVVEDMDRISASYEALKPCPLPEVADLGFPNDGPDYVSTPNYFQKRFKNPDGTIRAYILIALNTDPEPRLNLHHHLEAGYFAFGREYFTPHKDWETTPPLLFHTRHWEWLVRCKAYTGFNFQESLTSSAFAGLLPKGAMPPTWRLKPTKVTATRVENSPPKSPIAAFRFTWDNGLLSKQSRTIEVLPDKVVVTDGGLFGRDKVTEYGV